MRKTPASSGSPAASGLRSVGLLREDRCGRETGVSMRRLAILGVGLVLVGAVGPGAAAAEPRPSVIRITA
ncbi:MAG TPA: hypothetical protein VIU44_05570, partial [Gaiellaceae bacterium]